MAAAALPIAAIGMTVLGGLSSANSKRQEQYAAAQASEYNAEIADRNALVAERNAKISDQNALIVREQTAADVALQTREAKRKQGAAIAAAGASGLRGDGSILDVLADSAAQAEADRQTLKYKGELRAMGYEQEAESYRYEAGGYRNEADFRRFAAGNAKSRGDNAFMTTMISTGTSLVKLGTGFNLGGTATMSGGTAP